LRLGIFGVGKSNPDVILLQNIKNRDPVLTGRFHADIRTVVFRKLVTRLIQTFGEGRKAGFFILGMFQGICYADTCINLCFVDIKTTTVIFEDFKGQ
jgi:hypothetical protein